MEPVKRLAWFSPVVTDAGPPEALAMRYPTDAYTKAEPLRQALAVSTPTVVVVPDTDDGGALTAALNAASGQAPVVVLVEDVDAEARELRALRAGAAEVLAENADGATIERTLARAWARFDHDEAPGHNVVFLRESEARLRALIEALPDAIVRIDSTGLIRDFHVPDLFPTALLPPDVVGKYAQDVLPDDMKPPYAKAAIEAFMTGMPVTFRHTTMVEGLPRHHEVCCVSIGTDEVLALVRDQTVLVEAEEALRRQERLMRHIVSAMPVIVFALDGNARFELIEGKGLDDIGRTREELEGALVPEFFGDNVEIMEALSAALDGESGKSLVFLNDHYFDLWFNPVFDDEGLMTGVIGIAANVTDLIAAQAAVEASRGDLRELAAHLQHIREEERTAISREVHDSLGQMLTSIRLDAAWVARHLATADAATVQERLGRVDAQVDETIQRVRQIAQALRPGILDDIGLASALDWQTRQFAQRTGLACSVTDDLRLDEADLPEEAATALFRIAQEALTNVARHAEASAVTLHLEETDEALVLHIRDDGKGLDPEAIAHTRSLGMLGMRERAGILGGAVTFDGAPGQGTYVRATVPLPGSTSAAG
ncbi:MAG: histidine kinase [Bacteroidota bacterium]